MSRGIYFYVVIIQNAGVSVENYREVFLRLKLCHCQLSLVIKYQQKWRCQTRMATAEVHVHMPSPNFLGNHFGQGCLLWWTSKIKITKWTVSRTSKLHPSSFLIRKKLDAIFDTFGHMVTFFLRLLSQSFQKSKLNEVISYLHKNKIFIGAQWWPLYSEAIKQSSYHGKCRSILPESFFFANEPS